MDEWMSGWMNGWLDEWMSEWMKDGVRTTFLVLDYVFWFFRVLKAFMDSISTDTICAVTVSMCYLLYILTGKEEVKTTLLLLGYVFGSFPS